MIAIFIYTIGDILAGLILLLFAMVAAFIKISEWTPNRKIEKTRKKTEKP